MKRLKYLRKIQVGYGILAVPKFILLTILSKFKMRDKVFCAELKKKQQPIFEKIGVSQDRARQVAEAIMPKLEFDDNAVYIERIHAQIFAALKESGFRPKNILELGTNHGNTSCFLAELFPDANVFTFELPADDPIYTHFHNDEQEDLPAVNQDRFAAWPNIKAFYANTMHLMAHDLPDFDLIWLDAGHEYPEVAWDHFFCVNKLRPGGWILSDDILLPGNFFYSHEPKNFHAGEVITYFNDRLPYAFDLVPKRCEPEQFVIFQKYIAVLHSPETTKK